MNQERMQNERQQNDNIFGPAKSGESKKDDKVGRIPFDRCLILFCNDLPYSLDVCQLVQGRIGYMDQYVLIDPKELYF